ncbi:MAG: 50S ribosomal protein L25 [Patescibacteria group bacterium]
MTQDTTRTEAIVLKAQARTHVGKQSQAVRRKEQLPAVVYGHGISNTNLSINYRQFEKAYRSAGGSRLIDLQIDDKKPVKVLIQDVQKHPVSDRYIHVDFHQVRMTEKISATITLVFTGEAKAVKEAGGILVKNLTEVKVECLPQDLVSQIDIPLTSLNTFDDMVRVRDIQLPSGIVLKEKEDEVVVSVQPPRSEEELSALEEKPEEKVEDVEVAAKEKKEGDEEEEPSAKEKPAAPPDKK